MKRPILFAKLFSHTLKLALIAGLLVSCDVSKKLLHDAQVLEDGGLSSEAYDKYEFIYQNYSSSQARVGMKRSAQQILNSKSQKAQMLCMTENFEASLTAYEDAISFLNKNQSLELNQPMNLEESYRSCKSKFVDYIYTQAESAVRNEEYDKAHDLIRKIYSLDRNNVKAGYLEMMCDILPNYNAGKLALENEMYREAYIYFDEVCKIDAGFSDARKLRDESLEKGSYSLVYRIIQNDHIQDINEESLAAAIKGKLLQPSNPFLELLERDQMDMIFDEIKVTMSPEFDDEGGAQTGKLKKARFILAGELMSLEYKSTPEVTSKCDCYATYRIYSDKVNCYQYTQSSTMNASFKYKLLDAETGKLFKSDVLSFSLNDFGKHYSYEIQKKISLTSPTLTKDHDVNLSNKVEPEVDLLLTKTELTTKMNEFFAKEVAKAMASFKP